METQTGLVTHSNGLGQIDYWPWYPNTGAVTTGYVHVTETPRECSGEVHVFPCPHCEKCKCGAATVKRVKGKK